MEDEEIICPICGCSDWKLFLHNWVSLTVLGIECANCGKRNNEPFDARIEDIFPHLRLTISDEMNKCGELIKCPHDGSETWKLFINDTHFSISCPNSRYHFGGVCQVDNTAPLDYEVKTIWQLIEADKNQELKHD